MATEEQPHPPTEEGSHSTPEPTPEQVPASTGEVERVDEGEKAVAEDGVEESVVLAEPVDVGRPRESLELEGSDLEEEMNQVSLGLSLLARVPWGRGDGGSSSSPRPRAIRSRHLLTIVGLGLPDEHSSRCSDASCPRTESCTGRAVDPNGESSPPVAGRSLSAPSYIDHPSS